MNATIKNTIFASAILAASILMAPQMAAADDEARTAQPLEVAAVNLEPDFKPNFKPMYVYQEPDSLETIEELEVQFAASEPNEAQYMMAADEDDC